MKNTTTKIKAKATPETAAPQKKVEYTSIRINARLEQLTAAPWNPRGEITPESVSDLAASIKTLGLIQPLVAMKDGERLTLIAGHRRLAAAKLAGLSEVPCEVLLGVDVETAKRMTFIENLQRKDADPLLESELVGGMMKSGMTKAEIAAETGRGEKWVARRVNLANLSKSWRKRVKNGEDITIDCLEHVAAYPEEIQERVKDARPYFHDNNRTLSWSDIRNQFARESRNLCNAAFDTTKCRNCPKNSGCCPELFDDIIPGKDAQLGKCLDAKCYEVKVDEHIDAEIKKAEAKGRTVVRKKPYDCGAYNTTKRPTKTNTALYVYKDYNDRTVMEWGEPPKVKDEGKSSAVTAAEKEKALEEKRKKRERNAAIRKLAEWCATEGEDGRSNLARLLANYFHGNTAAPFLVQEAFSGMDCWHFHGCKTNKNECAISAIFGNFEIAIYTWAKFTATELIRQLDPSRCEGIRAAHNARLLLAMFPYKILEAVGAEAYAAMSGNRETVANPEIKWYADDDDEDAAEVGDERNLAEADDI